MGRRAAWLAAALACQALPAPVRVLLVTGENDHQWKETAPLIERLFRNNPRFDLRVTEAFAGATASTLAPFDVLVVHYHGPRWGAQTERAVEEFVRSGKGMVSMHGASYAFGGYEVKTPGFQSTGIIEKPWPEYRNMIGAYWKSLEKGHGLRHTFTVRFRDRSHPIAAGMPETFLATDELYHGHTVLPEAKVLATAFDDPKMNGTGRDEPILWTVSYGRGRTFHSTLGHDAAAVYEPGFLTTLARAAEWAATGQATLPAQAGWGTRNQDALRVMAVTGGHACDTSFPSVFEGYPDIAPFVYPRNVAFARDLRERWDALVLYDLTLEAAPKEKEILTSYLEAGKGLVVLHHAVADHAGWPWWYEEVVGGKYFTKPEGGRAISTYKVDQDLLIAPAGKHPITANLGRLHVVEEAYKNLWISPRIQPLLVTGHPASDPTVAWVGPYDKARVVYIQLGHDRKTHLNPAYRLLVRNALLWVGRRL